MYHDNMLFLHQRNDVISSVVFQSIKIFVQVNIAVKIFVNIADLISFPVSYPSKS